MTEDYYNKVLVISKIKYELPEDILEGIKPQIEECYNNGFKPRRTVEYLAMHIFDLI